MNTNKAIKNPRMLKAILGISKEEFETLLKTFTNIYQEEQQKKKRKRAVGGGRKGNFKKTEQKLFYALFYLKVYPTFDVAAFIFNSSKTRTHNWKNIVLPFLEKTLGRELVLPKRKIRSIEEFKEVFPEIADVFLDGTERRIQKPKKSKNNKKNYSGKKKCQTRKNLVMSDDKKRILYLSSTKAGKTHDKKISDKTNLISRIPKDVCIWADTGFQGIQKQHKNILMPTKKSKGKFLTNKQKEENKTISSIRIIVENAIAGIKRYNCLSHAFRNKNGSDDMMMNICSGLWNFHLERS
jgi:hypothetical protein